MRKKPDGRFWELDLLRGIAIVLMVLFHFIYDLNHLQIIYFKLWEGPFDYSAKLVASIFFLLVGISLTLTYNKSKPTLNLAQIQTRFLQRGAKLFFLGLILTLISYLIIPERFVLFGVLHCIGISIILSIPIISYKISNLLIGGIIIFLGLGFQTFSVDYNWLIPLGILPPKFFSIDFFPLFPWFGIVLVGICMGHYLYPEGKRRFHLNFNQDKQWVKNICFLGRHSLHIYFLHQPFIFAIIFLIIQPLV